MKPILIDANCYPFKSWTDYGKDVEINNLKLANSWRDELFDELFAEPAFKQIHTSILADSKDNLVFPYPDLLFSAFNYTSYDNTKVVILGQDPYHGMELNKDQELIPQAMGLSFSVPYNMAIPSSLKNIYNNLNKYGHLVENKIPTHGNLQSWANQGCLMLNTALTVKYHSPNCHAGVWSGFTDKIIRKLSDDKEDLVFVLWGAPALKKLKLIDESKHKVIVSSHPSGLSYKTKLREYSSFFEFDHFGEINKHLKKNGLEQILF